MTIVTQPSIADTKQPLNVCHASLTGLTDYAQELARVAALYDAVTRDGTGAAAFVLALVDFASRHALSFDTAMHELIDWLNQRADVTRLCVAATFGGV